MFRVFLLETFFETSSLDMVEKAILDSETPDPLE
jgi:hypothetical protein